MKIRNKIATLFQKTRITFYRHILSNTKIQGDFRIYSPTLFCTLGSGSIQIEKGVILGVSPSPCFYSGSNHIDVRGGGKIIIKKESALNNNFCLIADNATITIGERCFIGTNFQALSSDFHGISINHRNDRAFIKSADITLENDCFIGNNVSILKGVRLGSGCVVAHSSVVTSSFPANSLIGGNPARLIKEINQEE